MHTMRLADCTHFRTTKSWTCTLWPDDTVTHTESRRCVFCNKDCGSTTFVTQGQWGGRGTSHTCAMLWPRYEIARDWRSRLRWAILRRVRPFSRRLRLAERIGWPRVVREKETVNREFGPF